MIVRAHAVALFCAVGSLVGCAHAVVDGFDDSSNVVVDAGKDAAQQPPKDAGPGKDTWQPPPVDASDPPDTSPVCSPELSTGIAQCDTCVGQNCCPQDNACANDPQCGTLIDCYNQCPLDGGVPDTNCMNTCDSTYPSGAAELNSWGQCLQTNCANDCR